jgi:hypothetical protein
MSSSKLRSRTRTNSRGKSASEAAETIINNVINDISTPDMPNQLARVIKIIQSSKDNAANAAGNAISNNNKVRIATIVGVEEGIEAATKIGFGLANDTQPNPDYRHVDKATIYVISAREGARIGALIGALIGADVRRGTKEELIEKSVIERINLVDMFKIIDRKIKEKGKEIAEQEAKELAREIEIERERVNARNAAARTAAIEARNTNREPQFRGGKRSFTSKKKQKRNRTSKKY